MPSPSTASQSRINAERLAHLLPKGNPPDSIRPEHALIFAVERRPRGRSRQCIRHLAANWSRMWRAGTMAGGSPFIEDIPDPSTFDSHLEIPTSGDPNANATLTLILRYKLEFADSKNRVPSVVLMVEGTARAKDSTGFSHYIAAWDDK